VNQLQETQIGDRMSPKMPSLTKTESPFADHNRNLRSHESVGPDVAQPDELQLTSDRESLIVQSLECVVGCVPKSDL
jgi:hypothetical protein